jgi:hypothetical protein
VVVLGLTVGCSGSSDRATAVGTSASSPTEQVSGTGTDQATSFSDLERGFDQGADNVCTRGEVECIDAVIAELRRHLDTLVARCDHLAPWALVYLRDSEGFRRLVATPGALQDPAFVTHVDMWFAKLYFNAYDNWYAGRKDPVPRAWQIAFEAADTKAVSALGDTVLAVNAHISGDLPVALANAGLPPDGSKELPDFQTANQVFHDAIAPIIAEVAARFDPTVAQVDIPGVADDEQGLLAVIAAWRDASFADGERISTAGAADLAAAKALPVRTGTSYLPFTGGSQQRDEYCQQHGRG